MKDSFRDKVVVVTGAASGIGKETARLFSELGASLALADINEAGLRSLSQELNRSETACFTFDAASPDSCRQMINEVANHFGRLDVLCNIAGIAGSWRLEAMEQAKWDLMMAINVTSFFAITQAAIPFLVKSRGNIVNMSSVASMQGQPYNSCYCASKAAVNGFTRAIAAEFSDRGVRANAVCPGGVKTPIYDHYEFPDDAVPGLVSRMLPLPGFDLAEAREIAKMVAYLASGDARFITGSTMVMDGGQTAL